MSQKILPRPKSPFTAISNQALNDPRISLGAKGLYAYMLAQPSHEGLTAKEMASVLKDSYSAISAFLKELHDSGWIQYQKYSGCSRRYEILHEQKEGLRSPEGPQL